MGFQCSICDESFVLKGNLVKHFHPTTSPRKNFTNARYSCRFTNHTCKNTSEVSKKRRDHSNASCVIFPRVAKLLWRNMWWQCTRNKNPSVATGVISLPDKNLHSKLFKKFTKYWSSFNAIRVLHSINFKISVHLNFFNFIYQENIPSVVSWTILVIQPSQNTVSSKNIFHFSKQVLVTDAHNPQWIKPSCKPFAVILFRASNVKSEFLILQNFRQSQYLSN